MDRRELIALLIIANHNFNNMCTRNMVIHDNELESDESDEEIINIMSNGLVRQTPPRIKLYVERIVDNYTYLEFQQNFRMTREAFDCLLQKYSTFTQQQENNLTIPIDKQLLAVIWLLSTPDSYRSVGERFDLAKSTLSKIFYRVVDFLNQISNSIIKFPDSDKKNSSKHYFEHHNAPFGLKGVIGAVDGTYIRMKAPKDQIKAYTNRKCYTSVTLQAISDHKMRYIDCFIGFPSSVHDSRIFRNSEIYVNVSENTRNYFSDREKILGDKAYPLQTWCIPPYIDRGRLTEQQKYFNYVHASRRSVIERSFALLFGRFRRLQNIDMHDVNFIPATVLAACVLHNICLDYTDLNTNEYLSEGEIYLAANHPRDSEPEYYESAIHSANEEQRLMTQEVWERKI